MEDPEGRITGVRGRSATGARLRFRHQHNDTKIAMNTTTSAATVPPAMAPIFEFVETGEEVGVLLVLADAGDPASARMCTHREVSPETEKGEVGAKAR